MICVLIQKILSPQFELSKISRSSTSIHLTVLIIRLLFFVRQLNRYNHTSNYHQIILLFSFLRFWAQLFLMFSFSFFSWLINYCNFLCAFLLMSVITLLTPFLNLSGDCYKSLSCKVFLFFLDGNDNSQSKSVDTTFKHFQLLNFNEFLKFNLKKNYFIEIIFNFSPAQFFSR